MDSVRSTTEGWDDVHPRTVMYYDRIDLDTAVTILKEMCAEWDYEADPHGYCHVRSPIQRVLRHLEGTVS